MRTVYLQRVSDNGVQTRGELVVDGFSCKTLERAWKFNKQNSSCIPSGEYVCKWTFSFKFLKYTYEVLNVPNRTGIRIHPGNFFFNSIGCIILGTHFMDLNKDNQLDIINSRLALKRFEDFMGRETFLLKIIQ